MFPRCYLLVLIGDALLVQDRATQMHIEQEASGLRIESRVREFICLPQALRAHRHVSLPPSVVNLSSTPRAFGPRVPRS
ncbi:hypothetical protein BKA81DRAFT_352847 [Phyllosticta paracitricarpa]